MDIFKGFDRTFTVLVADDLPENLALIRDILESPRCRVLLARNGKEALNLAFEHQPDLVLLDVMMPEMDGYQVCHELKAQPRHPTDTRGDDHGSDRSWGQNSGY